MHQLYVEKGHQHWRLLIADSHDNLRMLWRTTDVITHATRRIDGSDDTLLTANSFAEFFAAKVNEVRADTSSAAAPLIIHTAVQFLEALDPVAMQETERVIQTANKTCQSTGPHTDVDCQKISL